MAVPYIRGWIGLGLIIVGIAMLFHPSTKPHFGWLLGFGCGMAAAGFS